MSLFQRTQGRITPGEIIFNNFYRGTSVTQQKKKASIVPKIKIYWVLLGHLNRSFSISRVHEAKLSFSLT